MTCEARLVWNLQAQLGEGALWDARDDCFWFTDIKRRKIYSYDPAGDSHREWDCAESVGFVVPARSGGFIAGLQSGLHRFDPESGRFELVMEIEPDLPGNRLNDAVADCFGRLWFGTMDNDEREKTGAFYCFHKGELRQTGIDRICITNGPAASPDGKTLYWVDTLARTICAAPIADDGTLGPSSPFVAIDPGDGHPDGPAVDCEGCLWIALYGGWEARRFSPSGDLLERVTFPVANVTKVALGGPDLRTGVATTARQGLDSDALAKQPLAGGLFAFRAGVPGLPSHCVADR